MEYKIIQFNIELSLNDIYVANLIADCFQAELAVLFLIISYIEAGE